MIDKPKGLTSHDVVDIVRRKLGIKRVGHCGTLDPIATGLLIILVDRATKAFNRFASLDKEYTAVLRLGVSTDTGDCQGKVLANSACPRLAKEKVDDVLKGLEGRLEIIPPMTSAKKYKGKPLYKLARKGITVERKPKTVEIHSLKMLEMRLPEIEFQVKCSKGTYVRTLGEEIAKRLGTLGHIVSLRRQAIGLYSVNAARDIESFNENDIQPI